jgi:hypothetical protein
MRFRLLEEEKMAVSSAYSAISQPVGIGISLINRLNRKGPIREP